MDVDHNTKGSSNKPGATVVIVTNLTRNVVEAHLRTVFGFYGDIVKIDLPLFGNCEFK
jgi:RNA-binding protein with serine-rich domain 1